MKEEYVIDLDWVEDNFESVANCKKGITRQVLVLKLPDGNYHSFELVDGTYTHMEIMSCMPGWWHPLPTAHPHKWVTLKTVTGEDVRCEFKATHLCNGKGVMLFNRSSTIASGLENLIGTSKTIGVNSRNDSLQVYEKNGDNLTPIIPANPLLDKISELKEDGRCARNLICITTDELDELEALAKEATHGK